MTDLVNTARPHGVASRQQDLRSDGQTRPRRIDQEDVGIANKPVGKTACQWLLGITILGSGRDGVEGATLGERPMPAQSNAKPVILLAIGDVNIAGVSTQTEQGAKCVNPPGKRTDRSRGNSRHAHSPREPSLR
ncbi:MULTISPECIES: hypothetical protein [unclassified Mesorhizobium]|uniref:hypothetical protein n=1 Tax=unclassified Mesorhizobium TaxID=325217 RepID=UPI00112A144C|nr:MULTISPECIES: hypothetical protein [unclassified Mesorhizobium]TPN56101.1 hypothetical protein FJ978_03565 [Mesorhizobium sp. B1-1-7]TPN58804.1 hypothetical protein FJ976_02490 [Mesorhizobium sp. B1-1-9]